MSSDDGILAELYQILRDRRTADPASSYVARLHHKGLDAILKKVAEESAEVLLAAKDAAVSDRHGQGREALVHELADLVFHMLVLMAHTDLAPEALLAELERRRGVSGLDEKASRGNGTSGD